MPGFFGLFAEQTAALHINSDGFSRKHNPRCLEVLLPKGHGWFCQARRLV